MEINELEDRISEWDVSETINNLLNKLSRAKPRQNNKDFVHDRNSIASCLSLNIGLLKRKIKKESFISFYNAKKDYSEDYRIILDQINKAIKDYDITI